MFTYVFVYSFFKVRKAVQITKSGYPQGGKFRRKELLFSLQGIFSFSLTTTDNEYVSLRRKNLRKKKNFLILSVPKQDGNGRLIPNIDSCFMKVHGV